jgi:hypothetical protein
MTLSIQSIYPIYLPTACIHTHPPKKKKKTLKNQIRKKHPNAVYKHTATSETRKNSFILILTILRSITFFFSSPSQALLSRPPPQSLERARPTKVQHAVSFGSAPHHTEHRPNISEGVAKVQEGLKYAWEKGVRE